MGQELPDGCRESGQPCRWFPAICLCPERRKLPAKCRHRLSRSDRCFSLRLVELADGSFKIQMGMQHLFSFNWM
ncbi:hypothetical protein DXC57_14735 [Clostridium sp. TF06-15AC]|nr:hypothetical protein DWX91_08020 [Clostridium sp. AF22-10]RHU71177.1 hypothetical protein DXC57_14735 [Clostridium sp. TF06-15AC]